MLPWIDFGTWDTTALAADWRGALPFPHVVIDDLVQEPALAELRLAISAEPHGPSNGELCEMMASAQPPAHATLRSFADALGSPAALAAVGQITGKTLGRVELSSYVYLAGGYLLPHSDHQQHARRAVSYAFYLSPVGACAGGELELFACSVADGEIVATQPALTIAPQPNRLVLFDVSLTSLHQVREVLGGARVSLAGWYYP